MPRPTPLLPLIRVIDGRQVNKLAIAFKIGSGLRIVEDTYQSGEN